MTAALIPFPLARRVGLIRRHALRYAESSQGAAENGLTTLLDQQRRVLLAKGIDAKVADDEIEALEGAIKAQVWRLILQPGMDA